MSRGDNWQSICTTGGNVAFDPTSCCAPSKSVTDSPIDDFYAYQESVLLLGQEEALINSDVLGRVLLLALVSGVESYFRTILSRIINCCSISRAHASQQMLTLAAVDYYKRDDVGLGLFEHVSFATEGEIAKQTKKITDLQIAEGSPARVAIEQFERISHLRHAAVHSRGSLNSRNVTILNNDNPGAGHVLQLRLPQLHTVASTCVTTVQAYNKFLYSEILNRWARKGLLSWQWKNDKAPFSALYFAFASERDVKAMKNRFIAYTAFRRQQRIPIEGKVRR